MFFQIYMLDLEFIRLFCQILALVLNLNQLDSSYERIDMYIYL